MSDGALWHWRHIADIVEGDEDEDGEQDDSRESRRASGRPWVRHARGEWTLHERDARRGFAAGIGKITSVRRGETWKRARSE